MPRYVVKFLVSYRNIGDGCCEPKRFYSSVQYFDAQDLDVGMEVARRLRRRLKDDFTYSVSLESLEKVVSDPDSLQKAF